MRDFSKSARRCLAIAVFAAVAAPAAAMAASPQAYDGLKKTVSVDPFLAAEAVGGSVTSDGLTAMLTDALVRDGRFVVVERPGLAGVQAEQGLGTASGTNAETAAKTGQLIGASVIVRGTVTKYEPNASGASLGIGGIPMHSIFSSQGDVKHATSTLEISLRMIDTTTGQVVSVTTAEGSASSNGADATLVDRKNGASYGGSAFQNTPIGQAAQDAIVKAVEQIAAGMRNVPWSAQVVDASGGKIYINAGANRNVQPGMVLTDYRQAKVLTDPSTGEVLDVEMDKIGTLRIDGVREKLSTAVSVDGGTPQRGDILKLAP